MFRKPPLTISELRNKTGQDIQANDENTMNNFRRFLLTACIFVVLYLLCIFVLCHMFTGFHLVCVLYCLDKFHFYYFCTRLFWLLLNQSTVNPLLRLYFYVLFLSHQIRLLSLLLSLSCFCVLPFSFSSYYRTCSFKRLVFQWHRFDVLSILFHKGWQPGGYSTL